MTGPEITALALAWHEAGRKVAIATVVQAWGSAPRPVGSQMIIAADGALEGSVSGGCVEGAVVTEAHEAITEGKARLLEYGVSDGDAFAVGLACGGTIRVLVEPVGAVFPIEVLRDLVAHQARRVPVAYVVDLQGSARQLVAQEAQLPDRSGVRADGRTFVAVFHPPMRMVIVGAVHIAQPLVAMASLCGYAPIVIDPRAAFATMARFPQAQVHTEWPDDVLGEIGLDARTCVVALAHDPKIDDPALIAALRSDACYIGALGSRRTHDARKDRLAAAGLTASQIARVHGPVGLPLGGRKPAEIALSVMAQVTQTVSGL